MSYKLSGAYFNTDRSNRYFLYRVWDEDKPVVMWVCLNPSTADETESDPTMRSIERISRFNGFGGFYIVNCFSFISTDPNKIEASEAYDIENKRMIQQTVKKCREVVFGWGGASKMVESKGMSEYFQRLFPNAKCLAKNKDGSPKHPLYCKTESTFIKFNERVSLKNLIYPESMLTPREVCDKYTSDWASESIWEYAHCSREQILAWGVRSGYGYATRDSEAATLDLINLIKECRDALIRLSLIDQSGLTSELVKKIEDKKLNTD